MFTRKFFIGEPVRQNWVLLIYKKKEKTFVHIITQCNVYHVCARNTDKIKNMRAGKATEDEPDALRFRGLPEYW